MPSLNNNLKNKSIKKTSQNAFISSRTKIRLPKLFGSSSKLKCL